MQVGCEGGSFGEGFSASRQIPRGQWERRLQTDIQMAKRALSEALSPEKKPSCLSASNSNPSDSSSSFSSTKPTTTQSVCYASSADNIARMLKGWMKNPPKSSRTNSSMTQNSFNNLAGADTASSSGAKGPLSSAELSENNFESLFDFDQSLESSNSDQFSQSLSPEATVLQDESKPDINIAAEIMPFSLLEKWLLDEAGCQEKLVRCCGDAKFF